MNAKNAKYQLSLLLAAPSPAPLLEPESKSAIASRTLWGGLILSALNVADILTGDPWSVNGLIKWGTLALGSALVAVGRWKANKHLKI